MLRSQLALNKNLDIKQYTRLVGFLKQKSSGYLTKKSKTLSRENIIKFLKEADDSTFLMAKVAMIIGIAGACRKCELTYLRIEDVVDEQWYFRVNILNSTTKNVREFVITDGDIEGLSFIQIIRKYIGLRPPHITHGRFFTKYAHGRCFNQPIGINSFGNIPKAIAAFIGLPNPTLYTGNCFRRSSATLLSSAGANYLKIKKHGGW